MSIFSGSNPLLTTITAAGASAYEIERSLRFNSSDSAYLSRTPASAGNRKTWTWAGWVKIAKLTTLGTLFGLESPWTGIVINSNFFAVSDAAVYWRQSANLLRDPSAWYHLVCKVDTTQATSDDRVRLYINGVEATYAGTAVPAQNTDTGVNSTNAHNIGRIGNSNGRYFDGYMADVHFIDGQALDPTSFGEFDANGVWQPIEYAGTYGTNGFYLPFNNTATAASVCEDASGNNNHWTPNNITALGQASPESDVITGITNDPGNPLTSATVSQVYVRIGGTNIINKSSGITFDDLYTVNDYSNIWSSVNPNTSRNSNNVTQIYLANTKSITFTYNTSDPITFLTSDIYSSGGSYTFTISGNVTGGGSKSGSAGRYDQTLDSVTVTPTGSTGTVTITSTSGLYIHYAPFVEGSTILSLASNQNLAKFSSGDYVQQDGPNGLSALTYSLTGGASFLTPTNWWKVQNWDTANGFYGTSFTVNWTGADTSEPIYFYTYNDNTNGMKARLSGISGDTSTTASQIIAQSDSSSELYFTPVAGGYAVLKFTPSLVNGSVTFTGSAALYLYGIDQAGINGSVASVNTSSNTMTLTSVLGTFSANTSNYVIGPNTIASTADTDTLVDTPTNYGTDTGAGAGGEVRGNYATLNPLVITSTTTLANGNLDVTSSGQLNAVSTIVPSSGKWYLEITLGSIVTNSFIGLYGTTPLNSSYCTYGINGYGFLNSGWGSASSTVSGTGVVGDVIGLAFDVDAKTLQYYKNGSSIGTISNFTFVQNWSIGISCNATVSTPWVFNFGQRPFAYPAPSGYKALCTANLDDPVVAQPSTVMDVKLYTGNNSTQSITGLAFSPDLVWVKGRNDGTYYHRLTSAGLTQPNYLAPNATDAEGSLNNTISSLDANGFTVDGVGTGGTNESGINYVAWTWDAGSSTVSNTDGSITSQVRANASAGFSIVSYTGDLTSAGNSTIGHGLNAAPGMVITKDIGNTSVWIIQHESLAADEYLKFDTDAASNSSSVGGGSLPKPTSTVFYGSYLMGLNVNTYNYIAYCFAPVDGYSSFGSYVGNGSVEGPFVYTGFRPAFVLLKCSSTAGTSWTIHDNKRLGYNPDQDLLFPNTSDAENSTSYMDFLSNGFKLRISSSFANASGETFVFAAFAESPFQYSRAR